MKISIGAKLGLGFMIMLLLVAASGIASLVTMRRLADQTAVLTNQSQEMLRTSDIWENLVRADSALERAVASRTDGAISTARFRQSELEKAATEYLASKPASATGVVSPLEETNQKYEAMFDTYLNFADEDFTRLLDGFIADKDAALSSYLFALAEMNKQAASSMAQVAAEKSPTSATVAPGPMPHSRSWWRDVSTRSRNPAYETT